MQNYASMFGGLNDQKNENYNKQSFCFHHFKIISLFFLFPITRAGSVQVFLLVENQLIQFLTGQGLSCSFLPNFFGYMIYGSETLKNQRI